MMEFYYQVFKLCGELGVVAQKMKAEDHKCEPLGNTAGPYLREQAV